MSPFPIRIIRLFIITHLVLLYACAQEASSEEKKGINETSISPTTSEEEKNDSLQTIVEWRDSIKIITREMWGANEPTLEMKTHELSRITIHHSAVTYRLDYDPIKKIKGLQSFSQSESVLGNGKKKEAWADIPYHFVIYANGEIVEGRDVKYVGDTNTEYDPTGHFLINLDGNFEEQEPTEAQLKSLINLSCFFINEYNLELDLTSGHKDFAQTLCPGKNVYDKIDSLKLEIGEKLSHSSRQ